MHLESHGIETGDPAQPFLARVTFGTRNRQDPMREWRADTLEEAQQQADDWLIEFARRMGTADSSECEPKVAQARIARLKAINQLEGLPSDVPVEPRPYSAPNNSEAPQTPHPPKPRMASPAKIGRVVLAARKAGIDVAGVRVWPDGSVAAFDKTCLDLSEGRPPIVAPQER